MNYGIDPANLHELLEHGFVSVNMARTIINESGSGRNNEFAYAWAPYSLAFAEAAKNATMVVFNTAENKAPIADMLLNGPSPFRERVIRGSTVQATHPCRIKFPVNTSERNALNDILRTWLRASPVQQSSGPVMMQSPPEPPPMSIKSTPSSSSPKASHRPEPLTSYHPAPVYQSPLAAMMMSPNIIGAAAAALGLTVEFVARSVRQASDIEEKKYQHKRSKRDGWY